MTDAPRRPAPAPTNRLHAASRTATFGWGSPLAVVLLACTPRAESDHEDDPMEASDSSEDNTDPTHDDPPDDPMTEIDDGPFATTVHPLLDMHCAGCHGALGPYAGLTLGPRAEVSGTEVWDRLVGVPSAQLPTMSLVEPGQPEQSFLYLKMLDTHRELPCPAGCGEAMPPAGLLVPDSDLDTIERWILDGATL